MSVNLPTIRVRAVLLAALAACSACGGGGGGGGGGDGTGVIVGGGGTSPPPPAGPLPPTSPPASPPTSPPVTITTQAVASPTTIKEGRPFTLDATGSTASDGSVLSYTWTQVSGPAVTIVNASNAQLTLSAAEVTTDTPVQFRLTAKAGAAQSEALVNVTFANVHQTPIFKNGSRELAQVKLDVKPRDLLQFGHILLLGSSEKEDDPRLFTDFQNYDNNLIISPSKLPTLDPEASLNPVTYTVPASNYWGPHLAVLDEKANRVRIFSREVNTGDILTGTDVTISAPCTVGHATVVSGTGLIVGQRGGFTVLSGSSGATQIYRTVNTGRPACAVLSPRQPINGGLFGGTWPALPPLITLDTESNELSVYRATHTSGMAQYQLLEKTAVQLNSPKPLKLVTWTTGHGQVSNAMALVFSDGEYEGEHRLVIVGLDGSHALVQRTHTWVGGAPQSIILGNLNGDLAYPEVIIISPDSPQAAVFESSTVINSIGPLGPPTYFEIGLGATAALSTFNDVLQTGGTLFAFPEQKLIKVIDTAP